LDWSSQEIAIAAALSGDEALMDAYLEGDVYLAFAKKAGLAPPEATKETHKAIRDLCKAVVLGVNYGMSPEGMANRAGISTIEARELLLRHRAAYPRFWERAEATANLALVGCPIQTRFGWKIVLGTGPDAPNERTFMNFPMQAHGAEMMRLACCEATEQGLRICTPVHDALLLEAATEDAEDHINQLRETMETASEVVMGIPGFRCRVDVERIDYPDRYMDPRGEEMWLRVMRLLEEAEGDAVNGAA
jgi:DNA polymerase I-like protein with 3'-5' exonuclease and polymerase domains